MTSMASILIAGAQAVLAPPNGGVGPIAFNCSMRDVAAEVTTGAGAVNQLSVLTNFQRGSGAVLETFDPGKILKLANLSTAVMTLNPVTRDSYIFVVGTEDKAAAEANLLIRPDRDEVTGALKPDYIGILAVKGAKNRTHVGFCEVAGGSAATDLFKSIDDWRAKGK